jgi:hypothetical protein
MRSESFWHDARDAARAMRGRPGFTAIVVVTFALGIAANAIMFGVVDRLLLRPPEGVFEPDRVARIHFSEKAQAWLPGSEYVVGSVTTYPMLTAMREGVPSLQEVSGFYCGRFTVGRGAEAEEPDTCLVTGNYFRLLGVRPALGARVAVITETMAKHLWPGADPIGQCLLLMEPSGGPCTEVVGVARNTLLFSMTDERALYYVPRTHPAVVESRPDAVLVRATPDSPHLAAAVRREIQAISPDMPYVGVQSYEELVAPERQPWRLGAAMFTVFGALALVIAAVGLYSVIAYVVTQRTREIGVRMALGAGTPDVVRLVLRDSAQVVVLGLGLGVAVVLLAGHWIQPLLYQTSAHDPAIVAAVAAGLTAVAVAASFGPAWRASRVNPAVALRAD